MSMFRIMNGWNRLFVLIGLIWVCSVIFIQLDGFTSPTEEQINQFLPSEYQDKPFTPEEYLRQLDKKEENKTIPLDIFAKAEKAAIHHSKVSALLETLKLIIYPLVSLYIIGWLIAWVIRGFRVKN